jgi:ankyrin repeat protein
LAINLLLKYEARDYNQELSAFFSYCEKGDIDSVKIILDRGVDINSKIIWFDPDEQDPSCDCYKTAITFAIKSGNYDLVDYMINHGAEINFDDQGVQPIFIALEEKQYKIAELLVSNGANKNASFVSSGGYYDFINGDSVYLAYLIKNNYPYGDYYGHTPLTEAANNGELPIVKILSEIVDFDELNKALCMSSSTEISSYLLDLEADINYEFTFDMAESGYYEIPLTQAIRTQDLNFVQFLVQKGADVNLLDKYIGQGDCFNQRESPLLVAVRYGNYEIVKYLISIGANVNYLQMVCREATSPLIEAVHDNNVELVKLLIESKAKLINYDVSIFDYIKERTDSTIIEILYENK